MVKKRHFADRYSATSTCDIVYFILNDGGYALIDGETTELARGDTVHVPKGATYYMSARTECVAFCQPRFQRDVWSLLKRLG